MIGGQRRWTAFEILVMYQFFNGNFFDNCKVVDFYLKSTAKSRGGKLERAVQGLIRSIIALIRHINFMIIAI